MPSSYKKSLQQLANYLSSLPEKSIVILAGAGISVSAGIPDFRSKGTGLYSQLEHYGLPTPTSIFDISYYCLRPRPFSSLSMSIFPSSKYKPTLTHHFFRLLERKGLLRFLYTQNIDELEALSGIPCSKVLQCHGSYCKGLFCVGSLSGNCSYRIEEQNVFRAAALDQSVAHCPLCGRVMKPHIVFFGEQLPQEFQSAPEIIRDGDKTKLLLIIGTSLTVAPFNFLAEMVPDKSLRALVNRDSAGYVSQALHSYVNDNPENSVEEIINDESLLRKALDYTGRSGLDLFLPGDIDSTIKELAAFMNCTNELNTLKTECDLKLDRLLAQEVENADSNKQAKAELILIPIFYTHSLRVPTSISIKANTLSGEEQIGMFGFSTPGQVSLLKNFSGVRQETVVLKLSLLPSHIISEIQPMLGGAVDEELTIKCFMYRNSSDCCVYAPPNCHWSSYCHSFIGLIGTQSFEIATTFKYDVWDMITRWPKSLTAFDECVEDDPINIISYRSQTSFDLPLKHFTDYSMIPLCDSQSFDCSLIQSGECKVGLVKSSPLSRYLAGSGDSIDIGKPFLVITQQPDTVDMLLQILPKYEDQLEDLLSKLQKRSISLFEDLKTMVKPYTIYELSFYQDSQFILSLVRYGAPVTDKYETARELIGSSLVNLVKRVAGDMLKNAVVR